MMRPFRAFCTNSCTILVLAPRARGAYPHFCTMVQEMPIFRRRVFRICRYWWRACRNLVWKAEIPRQINDLGIGRALGVLLD
jgi:hypothetical protein